MSALARILLVEDEPAIRRPLALALRDAGHAVAELGDGADLGATLQTFRPDLVVLDVMLPGASGLKLAGRVRSHQDLPIIFLTARDAATDRIAGFAAGGDDYVVKPFVMEELLARIRAVLRRCGRGADVIEVGDLIVDADAGVVARGGVPVDLTATELKVLGLLARHRGRVLSKVQILTQVWGYDGYDPNVVEVHVSTLRRKLEAAGPRLIQTERGLGYVLRAA